MTWENEAKSGALPRDFHAARRLAALVGLGGIVLCLFAWIAVMVLDHRSPGTGAAFYKAYLFAWLFCLGVSLGSMGVVMIHHLTGGEWGYFIRRTGEAAANVLPLLFVLFIPILVGLHRLYPWADRDHPDAVISHKRAYLNPAFFTLRFVAYFAIWTLIARRLRNASLRNQKGDDHPIEQALQATSAIGLVVYFITMSMAAIDWMMSLEPEWYSTIFGFIVCMGQAVSGLAVLILMLSFLSRSEPFISRLRPRHFSDLATFLVTLVILWAYNAFAQLLIVWMGNLQREITWYVKRTAGPWRVMAALLIFLGFVAPFVLLLQRSVKKRRELLQWVCIGILITRLLDLYWMIAPSGREPYPEMHWFNGLMSIVALLGIGGLWLAVFLWLLESNPLMPLGTLAPGLIGPSSESGNTSGIVDHGPLSERKPGLA